MKLSELSRRDVIDEFNNKVETYNQEVDKDNWRLLPWPKVRDVLLAITTSHVVASWVLRLLGW